jgi:Ni,Fe-hydrogenase III small subunit
VENVIAIGESQWMGGDFLEYAGSLNRTLPVDAHELVAPCALRPVFIIGGSTQRRRVDAKIPGGRGPWPAYRLLGKKDLGST